jgi:hypothetical protein
MRAMPAMPPAAPMAPPMPADAGVANPGAPPAAPNPMGLKVAAAAKITEARKVLEAALVVFGSESEEGAALVTAIKSLGTIFPAESAEAATPPASAPMGGPTPGAQMGL